VFDHIEAGAFEEHPAREHAGVLRRAAFADFDLHESAGLLRQFPRRGALAGGHPDDDRADLARLAGLQLDFFGDIVALVEQAEHRDAFVHRGGAVVISARGRGAGGRRRGSGGAVDRDLDDLFPRRGEIVAGRQRQRGRQQRGKADGLHPAPQLSAPPGVHAS